MSSIDDLIKEAEASPLDADILELSKLSVYEYQSIRAKAAEHLGLKCCALDEAIKEKKRELKSNNTEATENLISKEIVPWDTEVDGEELFNELRATIKRHCIIPEKSDECIVLFVLFTYLYDKFFVCPILAITSASKRCGKTVLLTLISKLCNNQLIASNISPAAVYRAIEEWDITLLIDEADTFLNDNVELRGVINSGHTKDTAYVVRTVGDNHTPKKFSTWCPKAIACIGNLPDTNADRSIEINLKRKKPNEKVEKLHLNQNFEVLQRKCKRWADDHRTKLGSETYLDFLNDRAADNWAPLLCIAEAIGADAKDLAIQAARALSVTESNDDTLGKLLEDTLEIFGGYTKKLASQTIVDKLNEMEYRDWPEFNRGKGLTPAKLSRLLRPLKIKPKQFRDGNYIVRGYYKTDFDDDAERYLEPKNDNTSVFSQQESKEAVTVLQANNDAGFSGIETVTTKNNVTLGKARKGNGSNECNVVTLSNTDWLDETLVPLIKRNVLGIPLDVAKYQLTEEQKLKIKSGEMKRDQLESLLILLNQKFDDNGLPF